MPALEGAAVGLHRAVELEELRVLPEGVGEDAVALALALTANDLGLPDGVRLDLDDLAVGDGADALRRLVAARAQPLGLGLALGAHAGEGLLAHLGGKIGAADADVLDREAEARCLRLQASVDLAHHLGARLGQRRLEAATTIDAANGILEAGAQPVLDQLQVARSGLPEAHRVVDLVGDEGVHDVEPAARGLHANVV